MDAWRSARGVPIWITEMNGCSQPDSPHAASLTNIYTRLLKLDYVEHIMWYNFRDKGGANAPSWETTGLVRSDFTPKAEYRDYAELIRRNRKR
ncbi:MAG: hypothetical protein H8E44_31645 [Planctomycetes bacterium]|nr:hypothetical protein [Planctomycetota bacterium]